MADTPGVVGSVIDRIIADFTWRQIGATVAFFVVLVVAGFIGFEVYTQSFSLTRLDREVSLLERMLEVQDQVAKTNDETLKETFESLSLELSHLVQGSPYATAISPSPRVIKALYFLLPWVALAFLIAIVGRSGGRGETAGALFGILVVTIPVTFAGAYIPDSGRGWIDYFLIPWGLTGMVIAVIMLIQRQSRTEDPPAGEPSL